MQSIDWQTVIAQLGASGIFMIGLVVVSSKFYQHYEDEISYLRGRLSALEEKLLEVQRTISAQK